MSTMRPKYLYKYRSATTKKDLQRLEELIVGGEIFFGASSQFNDPFDLNPVFSFESTDEEYVQRGLFYLTKTYGPEVAMRSESKLRSEIGTPNDARHPLKRVALQRHMGQMLAKWGVLCLALEPDNILMWSHYAASCSGVCVEIDTRVFNHIEAVRYSAVRPVINALPGAESAQSAVTKAIYTKSIHWEYEREWRAIDNQGCQVLPATAITKVVFGVNCRPETREIISGYLAKSGKAIKLAEIELDDKDFVLKVKSA